MRQLAVARDSLGQAEIGDEWLAVLVEQDVRRFQVAVEDAPLVGVVHRQGGLLQQRRGRFGIRDVVGELFIQARPADQLHAEIALAVVVADLQDGHDVRMVERGDRLGLVLEPPQIVVAGQRGRPDHLEGHGAVEADLTGLVDNAHAAAPNSLISS